MKKYVLCIMPVLLAISLCACLATDEPAVGEPQSIPDIESIVEPVAEESESQAEYPDITDTPNRVAAEEHPAPVINDFAPPCVSEAETQPETDAPLEAESFSGLLGALIPDLILDSGRIERELLRLINALRTEQDVNALGVEDHMLLASRIRAAEAFESFSHTRPDGTPYNTAFDEAGFSYNGKWHGENLSLLNIAGGSLSEEEIALKMFDGLKSSPGHYRNMTEENFVQAGIGVAVTYTDSGIEVTSAQLFAGL